MQGLLLPSERSERLRRKRRLRRRRRAWVGVLLLLAAAVILLITGASGGGAGRRAAGGEELRARTAHVRAHAGAAKATRPRRGASAPRSVAGLAAATRRPGSDPVPILTYHVIAAPPAGARFPGLYVTPAEFAAQMQALKRAGWHAVTLAQVAAYWRDGVPLPPGKPFVATFDNGYDSQYTQALPVLRALGWVGVENIQLTGLPPSQGGLSKRRVRGLLSAGWELNTQGISHADLTTLGTHALYDQVAVARRTLQREYGVPVDWFCYPSGQYDAAVIAAVKAAGYEGSTTVVPGWANRDEDPYRLHRLRVLGGTSPAGLLGLISATREDPPSPASYETN